jgi:hypothetical protein
LEFLIFDAEEDRGSLLKVLLTVKRSAVQDSSQLVEEIISPARSAAKFLTGGRSIAEKGERKPVIDMISFDG